MPQRIIIGNDHRGYDAKVAVAQHLRDSGYEVIDIGSHDTTRTPYPDPAIQVASAVARGQADKGILLCSTGLGMSIAANKVLGVRATLCTDSFMAKMAARHNNANVLCLGSMVTGLLNILDIVDTWLADTYEGGRHEASLAMLADQETKLGLSVPED